MGEAKRFSVPRGRERGRIRRAAAWAAVPMLLLAGCASLMEYPVAGQEEVQAYLDERLGPLQELHLDSPVAAFDFSLRAADVTLGPEQAPDRVQLDLAGQAELALPLGGRESAAMQLRLRGLPDYDREAGAVYVRELELVGGEIDSRWFQGPVTPLARPLVAAVGRYLEENPVYEFAEGSATGQLLSRVPAGVQVEPGRLVLKPE
ncbi:DUF1439 domain-containing protein [Halorhodospira neutriphila]|uniref:Lipoprotein n=1 Tax=Halorhodospira neutriphila TaxID=168379 RepID=A0ABS1E5F6_9GAMM|nr:DUF1439 domain-containing protein [Halorhodospira neutriphila]MBK1725995.1 hypothetical protein [Halorhodospira neutriphila]